MHTMFFSRLNDSVKITVSCDGEDKNVVGVDMSKMQKIG